MFTPILGQELERREHHRRPWWVVLGLVAALAGEEATAGGLAAAAGPAIGFAEARTIPAPLAVRGIARTSQHTARPSPTNPTVSNLYWRDLESAQATMVRQTASQRRHWRFDTDLRAYLASLLRAPTG